MDRELGLASRLYFSGANLSGRSRDEFCNEMHDKISTYREKRAIVLDTQEVPAQLLLDGNHYFGTFHLVNIQKLFFEGFQSIYDNGAEPEWLLAGGMNFGDIAVVQDNTIRHSDLGLWENERPSYTGRGPASFEFKYHTAQNGTRQVPNPAYDPWYITDEEAEAIPAFISQEYLKAGAPEGLLTVVSTDPFSAALEVFTKTCSNVARLQRINDRGLPESTKYSKGVISSVLPSYRP